MTNRRSSGKRRHTSQMAVRRPHGRQMQMARQKTGKRSVWLMRFRYQLLFLVLLVPILAILIVVPLRWIHPPVTAFMLQQTSADERKYTWVPLDEINQVMWRAVIAAEDQRFTTHNGVDVEAIRKAIDEANSIDGARGASTITQQLVKNLYLWPERSIVRKGIEFGLSILLDACLSKRRILELYLNVVEFGPGIYGAEAASQTYFYKPARLLNSYEAALLAAVLPNPAAMRVSAPSTYVRGRQQWILRQMRNMRLGSALQER